MLLKTFMFDAKNYNWTNDKNCNFAFLTMTENYLNETIRHRGYVYLNQICEQLGVEWDPDEVNLCVRNDGIDRTSFIQFEISHHPMNSILVNIWNMTK